jgi:hypothetical protein
MLPEGITPKTITVGYGITRQITPYNTDRYDLGLEAEIAPGVDLEEATAAIARWLEGQVITQYVALTPPTLIKHLPRGYGDDAHSLASDTPPPPLPNEQEEPAPTVYPTGSEDFSHQPPPVADEGRPITAADVFIPDERPALQHTLDLIGELYFRALPFPELTVDAFLEEHGLPPRAKLNRGQARKVVALLKTLADPNIQQAVDHAIAQQPTSAAAVELLTLPTAPVALGKTEDAIRTAQAAVRALTQNNVNTTDRPHAPAIHSTRVRYKEAYKHLGFGENDAENIIKMLVGRNGTPRNPITQAELAAVIDYLTDTANRETIDTIWPST